jgi:uncharacterized RDD family membrane protein YckC
MSYPNALRRYIATLIDAAVAWALVYSVVRLAAITGADEITFILVIVAVAAYEPLSMVYGCTLGQALMRFRVRTVEGLKRISVPQAYGRFAVKYLLGVISFLTMPARSDRRAIHDLASETIVVEAASDVG